MDVDRTVVGAGDTLPIVKMGGQLSLSSLTYVGPVVVVVTVTVRVTVEARTVFVVLTVGWVV